VLLNNLSGVYDNETVNIAVHGGKIMGNENPGTDHFQIYFTNALVFPGLINSHDHLDFNCFYPLGQRKYNNYSEWGNHIHASYKDDINKVLKIPQSLRTGWGIYKNLLAGITTVVNHGPQLKVELPFINVIQSSQNLHSVKFQRAWKFKLNNPLLKKKICVIHAGEGTDQASTDEIDQLLKYNWLKRGIVGVHGVAMSAIQANRFMGLIWCPESNRVLLDQHADIATLKSNTRLVFGTDSTLTGHWNIWRHLRLARSLKQVSDLELFSMVTGSSAKLWNINSGELSSGRDADIVIVKKHIGLSGWDDVFATNPEDILFIMHKGKIRLFDKSLLPQLKVHLQDLENYCQISIKGIVKYIEGDLPALMAAIKSYNPESRFPIDV
jgi:hypothetical protein